MFYLGNIILQTLAPINKHALRVNGFELLLYFIQALQTPSNEQIDEQIIWFSWAVNLKPFVTQYQSETNTVVKLKSIASEGI
jgi:hypothetical protein